MSEMERLNIVLAARDREFARAMEKNTARVERFSRKSNKNLSRTSRHFSMMGAAARLATPLIAGLGAAAVIGKLKSTIAALDDIGKTADKIGLTTDALQELRAAAESAGVSQTKLDSSLERFSKRIGEAVLGTGAAKKALVEMGISAQSLADMGLDNALSLIADEMAKISDPTERAARAAALFGREGVAMVNLMREGSAGMATMRAEARELGIVIDESLIRKAEESQTKLDLMSRVISAQLSQALINLAPLLVGAAENIAAITTAVNSFLSINFDMPELMDAERLRDVAAGMKNVQSETMALSQATASYNANLDQFGEGSAEAEAWLGRQEAARRKLAVAVNKQRAAEASLQDAVEGGAALAASVEAAREKLRLSELTAEAAERERISKEKNAMVDRIFAGYSNADQFPSDANMDRIFQLADEFEAAEIAASKILNPVEAVAAAASGAAKNVGDMKDGFDKAKAGAESLRRITSDTFADILTNASSASDAVADLFSQLARMAAQAAFSGLFGNSDIFGSLSSIFTSVPSADGGGHTGSAPRSGGLDGKGGFMAMLHPQESIIDHTKGQSAPGGGGGGGGAPNISIYVSGARGNSEISEMVETGVRQGLQEYDRSVLPRSVQQINNDPRRLG